MIGNREYLSRQNTMDSDEDAIVPLLDDMSATVIGVSSQTLVSTTSTARKLPQYVAALTATLGAFALGTALAWSSPALPKLMKGGEAKFKIEQYQESWISSLLTLGAAAIALPIGYCMDWIGRKLTMIILAVPFVMGWALIVWATNVDMLYAGRFFCGMSGGAFAVVAPVYIGETAQKDIRGTLGTYFQLMICGGILFAYIVGSYLSVFWFSIICGIIPIIFAAGILAIPESPAFLLAKGKVDEARKDFPLVSGRKKMTKEAAAALKPANIQKVASEPMDSCSEAKDAVMEMQDCRTFVRTTEGDTGHIHLRAGVKQGCPLSPTLFNLGIEHVIRAAQEEAEVHGIRVLDTTISVLGYADDIVLVGKSADHLQALLDRVGVAATDAGLRFNPAKCSTLSLDFRTSQPVEPRQFNIQGGAITSLREGESYKYLGVPFGFRVCQTPREELQKLGEDVRKIDESLLAPWQKISATSTFLLSRLDFIIRAGNVRKTDLAPTDRLIKTCCKRWLNLPTRASNEIVYIHHRHGGAGLLPLTDLTDVLTVVHGYRLLNCRDPVVKKMAWGRLREVVKRKMKRMPSTADLMAYLSGNTEAPFGSVSGDFSSLFTQVRSASRRLRDRIALSWRWSDILNEPQIVLGGGEASSRVLVPPRAIGVLAKTLKNRVREAYLARLVAKPDQGKVFSASSVAAASSHFLVGGRYTRFCDWRFIHRARLDVLPLNACRRYDPSGDRRCRRCGYGDETLPHVLNHCTRHSLTWRRRHDSVLTRLTNAIMGRKGRSDEEVRINRTVPEVNSDLRPDILITDKKTMTARMIDVTIPFDNRRSALQEARRLKEEKYAGLAADLAVLGYSASVEGFVVGSLGSWDPENDRVLRGLGIPRRYAFLMKKLMVSDVIRWSRDLYVEHITGHRQYEDGIGGDG